MVAQDRDQLFDELCRRRGEQAGLVVHDRILMTSDARRDGRRAAGRRLGEGHAPTLGDRRARDDPGAPVEIEQFVVGDPSRQPDPLLGAERLHESFEVLALIAVADHDHLEIGDTLAGLGRDTDHLVEPLGGHEATDGEDERPRMLRPTRGEAGLDSGRYDLDAVGLQSHELDELLARRLRQREHRHPAIQRRRDLALEDLAHARQTLFEHHAPHLAVHVVHQRDLRAARPQGRQERHTVPDLDQPVARPVEPPHLGDHRRREHHVAARGDGPRGSRRSRPRADGPARTNCAWSRRCRPRPRVGRSWPRAAPSRRLRRRRGRARPRCAHAGVPPCGRAPPAHANRATAEWRRRAREWRSPSLAVDGMVVAVRVARDHRRVAARAACALRRAVLACRTPRGTPPRRSRSTRRGASPSRCSRP